VPTAVLAQNDGGVGVRNAVNLKGVKNHVGTFAPPLAVLNDFDFLERLPVRERIAGLAEAVKAARNRDAGFFRWLEANADALAAFARAAEEELIRRCAALHMRQIAEGAIPSRRARRARSISASGRCTGSSRSPATMCATARRWRSASFWMRATRCSRGCLRRARTSASRSSSRGLGFRVWHLALAGRAADGRPAILKGLDEFREHLGGRLTVTLLAGIGVGTEVHEVDPARVLGAMERQAAREAGCECVCRTGAG
jgi:3-dehydroquinate synthase